MSLSGSIEDLALSELLQIAKLSRKPGYISVSSRGREGKIIFRDGHVVEAASSTFKQSYGELLIRKGIINLDQMRRALTVQREEHSGELLGAILVRLFGIPLDAMEEVAREQVENVVHSLFEWAEGAFEFHVDEEIPEADPPRESGSEGVVLAEGLDAEVLAVAGQAIEADNKPPVVEEAKPLPPAEVTPAVSALLRGAPHEASVVFVDDDAVTRTAIADALRKNGIPVESFATSEDILIRIDSLYSGGGRPLVLVDLIMPRMDGSGILGGLELLDFLKNTYPDLGVLVLADYHNAEAERRVLSMGHLFTMKPRKNEIAAAVTGFAGTVVSMLAELDRKIRVRPLSPKLDLGETLRSELGDEDVPGDDRLKTSPGASLLRGMLEELHDPSLGVGVKLLVLRFASEFMNRAILFVADEVGFKGVGQFGVAGKQPDERVKSLIVPYDQQSMFNDVMQLKLPMKTQPEKGPFNTWFFDRLGGGTPREVFLGPILSEGRVIAVLYCDNIPRRVPVGDTESLEIFLSQAGLPMERALVRPHATDESNGYGVTR